MTARKLPHGEVARKAVHLLAVAFAVSLRWLSWQEAAACAIVAILANWLIPLVIGGFLAMLIESLLPQLGPHTKAGTNAANIVMGPIFAYGAWTCLSTLPW